MIQVVVLSVVMILLFFSIWSTWARVKVVIVLT